MVLFSASFLSFSLHKMLRADSRFTFLAEYFDPQASMVRQYQLVYYSNDQTIEMYDIKNKRVFLKRCPYPSLDQKELFVGSTITIFSRQLKLVAFGDESTTQHFAANAGEFFLIIYGAGLLQAGNIVAQLSNQEVRVANIRLVDLAPGAAKELQVSPRCYILQASGNDAWKKADELHNRNPTITRVFTDASDCSLLREIGFHSTAATAVMKNCSVCVIKPHAINSGHAGPILQRLLDEGFEVSALGMFTLSPADAEDFLEVYKGVVPEHKRLVEQCASAPCWAIEVRAENAVASLRAVCGPHDPEICHVLFPHTIRSKFGLDRALNGVHCTDLEEDGPLESEFFFSLMLNKA